MQSRTFLTRTPDETVELGRRLAGELPNGAVLLIGNLGAGKTTLAKGIVDGRRAAGVDEVSSPTFTLVHQYSAVNPVFHIDLYRLDEPREVETLGLDELFSSGALVLLEWAERFPELMPADHSEITIRALPDESREVVVSRVGRAL